MKNILGKRRARLGAIALATAGLVVLAGCSSSGGDGDAGGSAGEGPLHAGLPWGSSAEEFAAAVADMDPVHLTVQSSAPSEASTRAWSTIEFKNRVEEYSGGKIEVEIVYANAISSLIDNDDAVVDGRLDMTSIVPLYEPSKYPVNALLSEMSLVRGSGPFLSELQLNSTLNEAAMELPGAIEEYTDQGLLVAFPAISQGETVFLCSEPTQTPADFKGLQLRVPGIAHSNAAVALEATPVSLTQAESYEALQRGVIDCTIASLSIAYVYNQVEVAPYVTHGIGVALPTSPAAIVLGQKVIDLPLTARQIVWDAAFWAGPNGIIQETSITMPETLEAVFAAGGAILPADDAVNKTIEAANKKLEAKWDETAGVPGFTERLWGMQDEWLKKLDELGYEDGGTLEDYLDWAPDHKTLDLTAWADVLYDEVLSSLRPRA
ncbi:MAG: hypothetical protein KDB08_01515 [Microthrixaceae bacterium]|nr:hypothetical protein [Microthrixaceae bacterium]